MLVGGAMLTTMLTNMQIYSKKRKKKLQYNNSSINSTINKILITSTKIMVDIKMITITMLREGDSPTNRMTTRMITVMTTTNNITINKTIMMITITSRILTKTITINILMVVETTIRTTPIKITHISKKLSSTIMGAARELINKIIKILTSKMIRTIFSQVTNWDTNLPTPSLIRPLGAEVAITQPGKTSTAKAMAITILHRLEHQERKTHFHCEIC